MTFSFKHTLAGILVMAMPAMAQAATTILDFDNADSSALQPVPLTTYTEDGYTFALTYTTDNDARGPAFFDTTCTGSDCNGDTDLVPETQGENGVGGNVLILQEELPSSTPDDDGAGGSITFTLLSGSDFILTGFSAIDDASFSASTVGDGTLGSISMPDDSDTGSVQFASSVLSVGDSFTLHYSGSGAFDSLVLQAVPVPASLPLLMAGVGGLVAMRRRSSKRTA